MKAPDLPIMRLRPPAPSLLGTGGEGKGDMRTLVRMWALRVVPPCQELEGGPELAPSWVTEEGVQGDVASKASRVH